MCCACCKFQESHYTIYQMTRSLGVIGFCKIIFWLHDLWNKLHPQSEQREPSIFFNEAELCCTYDFLVKLDKAKLLDYPTECVLIKLDLIYWSQSVKLTKTAVWEVKSQINVLYLSLFVSLSIQRTTAERNLLYVKPTHVSPSKLL